MGNTSIKLTTHLCENRWILLSLSIPRRIIVISFSLILIGITSICYVYRQRQQKIKIVQDDEYQLQCEDEIIKQPDQQQVAIQVTNRISEQVDICLFSTVSIDSVDFYAVPITVEINKPIDEVCPLIEERKLVCYCDGSYSHHMQIGHYGFRTSAGEHRVRSFFPGNSKNGSTDTEVLAAYLAIQYALEKRYNALIIYTDNSKVEQLLTWHKRKDNRNYSNICQIVNQYRKEQGNNAIQVVRVRGHTSKYEQQNCKIKYEFAKIDQLVRKKTRQYIKRWWGRFKPTYYCYWYKLNHYSYYAWQLPGSYA